MNDFQKQLKNYRLTTAEILYHLPDYPEFLQSYIWQEYDIAPKFPELYKFLSFWEKNIEGRIHSVQMASKKIISPGAYEYHGAEYTLQ